MKHSKIYSKATQRLKMNENLNCYCLSILFDDFYSDTILQKAFQSYYSSCEHWVSVHFEPAWMGSLLTVPSTPALLPTSCLSAIRLVMLKCNQSLTRQWPQHSIDTIVRIKPKKVDGLNYVAPLPSNHVFPLFPSFPVDKLNCLLFFQSNQLCNTALPTATITPPLPWNHPDPL